MKKIAPIFFMLAVAGCGGGSSGNKDAAICTGGPVTGAADTHCQGDGGLIVTTVDKSACAPSSDPAGDYGDAMYDTSGRDDDCKYTVSYTVDPICANEGVTFVVTAKYATDGTPVIGAKTRLEAFLSDTHPAPNSGAVTTETTPGTYTIGPVKFDAAGKWTVRYHFFEACADAVDSPHGHASFYLDVP